MAFSYDPSIPTDKDHVRLLLGDTDSDDPLLEDEEIQFFLNNEGSVLAAAVKGAETIAAIFARRADVTIGDYSESLSRVSERFFELAKKLNQDMAIAFGKPFAGGISQADKEATEDDTDRVKPRFKRDQFENPRIPPISDDDDV